MRKLRTIIVWISFASIVVLLVIIDYDNLMTKSNFGLFLGVFVAVCNILTSVLSNRAEKKRQK